MIDAQARNDESAFNQWPLSVETASNQRISSKNQRIRIRIEVFHHHVGGTDPLCLSS